MDTSWTRFARQTKCQGVGHNKQEGFETAGNAFATCKTRNPDMENNSACYGSKLSSKPALLKVCVAPCLTLAGHGSETYLKRTSPCLDLKTSTHVRTAKERPE